MVTSLFQALSATKGSFLVFLESETFLASLCLSHFLSRAVHSVHLDDLPAGSPSAAVAVSVWRHLWLLGCKKYKSTHVALKDSASLDLVQFQSSD